MRAVSFVVAMLGCALQRLPAETSFAAFHAPFVSCVDSQGRISGSKSVRTKTVGNSTNNRSAYAEVRSDPTRDRTGCSNTARLFITDGDQPHEVYSERPSGKTPTAVSMAPVAWSPDGRWLAIEYGDWIHASDYAAQALMLYDSASGRTATARLLPSLNKEFGSKCSAVLYTVDGFNSRGQVEFSVREEPEDGATRPDCTAKRRLWLFDPVSGSVSQGAATAPPKR